MELSKQQVDQIQREIASHSGALVSLCNKFDLNEAEISFEVTRNLLNNRAAKMQAKMAQPMPEPTPEPEPGMVKVVEE